MSRDAVPNAAPFGCFLAVLIFLLPYLAIAYFGDYEPDGDPMLGSDTDTASTDE